VTSLIVIVLVWVASVLGVAWWSYGAGQDSEIATQAREDRAAVMATEHAASAAADAISRMHVVHQTITQEVRREIVERPVYRDCKHSPEQLRRLNAAITAEPVRAPGGGGLPAADGAQ
jgi:uncharacterized protein HemX